MPEGGGRVEGVPEIGLDQDALGGEKTSELVC